MSEFERTASELRRFARELEGIQRLPEAAVNRVCRTAALEVLRGVLGGAHESGNRGTPVDTGYHRSQWFATIGSPSKRRDPPPDQNGVTPPSSESVFKSGSAVVSSAKPFTQVIWLTNNGPAIRRLEEGYSSQSRGFVFTAVQQMRRRLRARRYPGLKSRTEENRTFSQLRAAIRQEV